MAKRRKRPKKKKSFGIFKALLLVLVLAAGNIGLVSAIMQHRTGDSGVSLDGEKRGNAAYAASRPELDVQLLTPNPNSRPQIPLRRLNGIVIHYTANPGSSAMQNRNYFEGLKDGGTKASSHFIIGIDGEIVQCIPSSEIAYASNRRNDDTLSIECCHPDESGKFSEETYDSLVELTAWLCRYFDISPDEVIRHYDVTGKLCPKYYVENEDAWEDLLADIKEAYDAM